MIPTRFYNMFSVWQNGWLLCYKTFIFVFSLTLSMLVNKKKKYFLIFRGNRAWHFIQTLSFINHLYELPIPFSFENNNCHHLIGLLKVNVYFLFILINNVKSKNVAKFSHFFILTSLRKHAYSNILKILPPKNWKFSDKNLRYFSYFCSKHRLWVLVRTASARRF